MNADEKLAIATEIIKGRERLGLTQAQLATASDVSVSAIKGYETGRSFPGARELRQISIALRVSPNVLLFGSEAPFSPTDEGDEPSALPVKGPRVVRERISVLLKLLAAEECDAVFAITHAIALARFGASQVASFLESADLLAGFGEVGEGEPFDRDLFRAVLKDPAITKEFVGALKAVMAESSAQGGRTKKL